MRGDGASDGRFAASRQSADRDEARAREHQEILRERKVGARLLAHGLDPPGRCEDRAQQFDLGPDRRPHREEQRQRRKSQEIAAALIGIEVGIEHGVGVGFEPALAEIHQKESEIVENVDGCEAIIELDRVEEDRRASISTTLRKWRSPWQWRT